MVVHFALLRGIRCWRYAYRHVWVASVTSQLLRYSALGTPEREKQEQWAIEYRTPGLKRWSLDPRKHLFLAYDAGNPDPNARPIAMSGWVAPDTPDARHHLRKFTLKERCMKVWYKIYDAVANLLMPQRLYNFLHPDMVDFLDRRRRWFEILDMNERDLIKPEHKEQGYWMLAFLGVEEEYERRGVASRLLKWGLDKADEEDRPVYLDSSPPGKALYAKHGFEVIYDEPCFVGEPHGGFHNVMMCRPPKSVREMA